MSLFDTHAHLNDPQLVARESEVISRAQSAGVSRIVAIGIDLHKHRWHFKIRIKNIEIFSGSIPGCWGALYRQLDRYKSSRIHA